MRYKLLASDMDGTLIGSDYKVSLENKIAVKKMVEKGFYFVLSSGRPYQAIESYVKELGLEKQPLIADNGCSVYLDGQLIYDTQLDDNLATEVIKEGRKKKVEMVVWSNGKFYAERDSLFVQYYKKIPNIPPIFVDDLTKISPVKKVIWYQSEENTLPYYNEMDKHFEGKLTVVPSRKDFLEFFDKESSKHSAMGLICEKLDIKKKEVVAVGDGFNDLSMLEFAGVGICMGNAHEQVKSKVKFVTVTCEENGVKRVIDQYFLNENSCYVDLYEYFSVPRNGAKDGFLYFNSSPSKTGSAMVVIAGGGYEHVSPREQDSVANKYEMEGMKTFILEYSTKVVYPTALVEASLAMAYIRENSHKWSVERDKVCGVGFSAGGHLLGCLGIIFSDEILVERLKQIEYFKNVDIEKTIKPDLMILSYPVVSSKEGKCHKGSFNWLSFGDNRLIDQLSLENRVNNKSTPAFIWATVNDNSVPVYSSLALALSYEKNQVPFSLHIFEKGKHGLSVGTKEVNIEEEILKASSYLPKWVEMSVSWLKDREFL